MLCDHFECRKISQDVLHKDWSTLVFHKNPSNQRLIKVTRRNPSGLLDCFKEPNI